MHQFEIGDRVVYKGGHTGIPIEAGEKGIVDWVSLTGSNTVRVLTDEGRVALLEGSDLELEDSPAPS